MIEGTYSGFEVELRPSGVGLITFTHPERLNAMSFGARRDLVEVLSEPGAGGGQLDPRAPLPPRGHRDPRPRLVPLPVPFG